MSPSIRIHFEEIEPPRGRAELTVGSDPPVEAFVGWLGLLHALYELLEARRGAPPARPASSVAGPDHAERSERRGHQ